MPRAAVTVPKLSRPSTSTFTAPPRLWFGCAGTVSPLMHRITERVAVIPGKLSFAAVKGHREVLVTAVRGPDFDD